MFLPNTEFEKRVFGCIFGAFLGSSQNAKKLNFFFISGDSIGSYLEFQDTPSPSSLEKALEMPGGGIFNLNPGQLTDDSEMAICLAKALSKTNGKFSLNYIAKQYIGWINSKPFDCGNTIGTALNGGINKNLNELTKKIILQAKAFNINSQSNGAIMKITPLAIWCNKLPLNELKVAVNAEVSLTHPSEVVKQAAVIYCYAIKLLLNDEGKTIAERMQNTYKVIDDYIRNDQEINQEIKNWWKIVESEELIEGSPNMGWIKKAWTYAFIFLKQKYKEEDFYLDIIKQVLRQGGDTDTNACIVGGLIGAAIGIDNLPQKQLNILISCNCEQSPQFRNKFFNASNVIPFIQNIIKIAPTKINFDKVQIINEEAQLMINEEKQFNLYEEEKSSQDQKQSKFAKESKI